MTSNLNNSSSRPFPSSKTALIIDLEPGLEFSLSSLEMPSVRQIFLKISLLGTFSSVACSLPSFSLRSCMNSRFFAFLGGTVCFWMLASKKGTGLSVICCQHPKLLDFPTYCRFGCLCLSARRRLSCLPAWHRRELPDNETDQSDHGIQMGQSKRVHSNDANTRAGGQHA